MRTPGAFAMCEGFGPDGVGRPCRGWSLEGAGLQIWGWSLGFLSPLNCRSAKSAGWSLYRLLTHITNTCVVLDALARVPGSHLGIGFVLQGDFLCVPVTPWHCRCPPGVSHPPCVELLLSRNSSHTWEARSLLRPGLKPFLGAPAVLRRFTVPKVIGPSRMLARRCVNGGRFELGRFRTLKGEIACERPSLASHWPMGPTGLPE